MNDFNDLSGKVAVITGGAGALGRAFALGLARSGVKTAILDLDETKAVAAALKIEQQTGTCALGLQADVLRKDSLEAALEILERSLGPIDFLINGAGGNGPRATTKMETAEPEGNFETDSFYGLDVDAFRQLFDLNIIGTVLPTQVLTTGMVRRRRGVIVNISSMNAFRPLTKIPAYSAAKCAVSNFTQWLAVHLASANIRVNAIAPGFFMTEQLRFLAYDENGKLTPRYEKVLAHTPMKRLGEPEELAGTLLYLLSAHSKFVTGIVIPVDGGFNAYAGV